MVDDNSDSHDHSRSGNGQQRNQRAGRGGSRPSAAASARGNDATRRATARPTSSGSAARSQRSDKTVRPAHRSTEAGGAGGSSRPPRGEASSGGGAERAEWSSSARRPRRPGSERRSARRGLARRGRARRGRARNGDPDLIAPEAVPGRPVAIPVLPAIDVQMRPVAAPLLVTTAARLRTNEGRCSPRLSDPSARRPTGGRLARVSPNVEVHSGTTRAVATVATPIAPVPVRHLLAAIGTAAAALRVPIETHVPISI